MISEDDQALQADKETLLRQFEAGASDSDRGKQAVLARGQKAVPPLLSILMDDTLDKEGSRLDGMAPVYAAELLGSLRAGEAVEPLLDIVEESDTLSFLHEAAVIALGAIGDAAVEPALRRYHETDDRECRLSLCQALVGTGGADERVYSLLLQQLDSNPDLAAGLLADYGHARAVEPLQQALSRLPVHREPGLLRNQGHIELADAIERLGGSLTRANCEKMALVHDISDRFRERLFDALRGRAEAREIGAEAETREPKVGRNQPCPCGSGKKYKKCCG